MSSGRLPKILDRLEKRYGRQRPAWPADPYGMILFANCGYPPSDASCLKGFEALRRETGIEPERILAASETTLARTMRAGGIMPELRAARLREIASRVGDEFNGDLGKVLEEPDARAKKALKSFPTIGDPGAEKILLFAGGRPVAAVPSNCVHVPIRLGFGEEKRNYA